MANHPLQSSGVISLSDINLELLRSSTAAINLADAASGVYGAINQSSPSKPTATDPDSISEWYGYNHLYNRSSDTVGLYNAQTCGTPNTLVYWDSANPFSTSILYYDPALTLLVTGYTYVLNTALDGYALGTGTGAVGALTYNC